LVPDYPYFSFVQPPVLMGKEHMRLYEEAVTVPSPTTEAVARAARSHGVVVLGINERDDGSSETTVPCTTRSSCLMRMERWC
jgi:aliphatic nitrilase